MADVFYGDLAPWWPLISPVEDYQDEALYFRSLFGEHKRGLPQRSLLELGSGGGHIASYFAADFELTLVDCRVRCWKFRGSRTLLPSMSVVTCGPFD
jgi:hypothetical protein